MGEGLEQTGVLPSLSQSTPWTQQQAQHSEEALTVALALLNPFPHRWPHLQ